MHRQLRVPVFILCASLAALGQTSRSRNKVILISLDGFPSYSLKDPKLPIPTLRKLIANGTSAAMVGINPTVTWPNHTAMITGVRADEHGLLANGTIRLNAVNPMVMNGRL